MDNEHSTRCSRLLHNAELGKSMRSFLLLFLLCSSLFFAAAIFIVNPVQGQNQTVYHIQLEGSTWDHTTLRILLLTPNNASWWSSRYLDDTLRAVGQWNDAIQYFASNYTNYAYLSFVNLEPTVSNQTQPGFDIYLTWTASSLENSTDVAGLTFPTEQDNVMVNSTINLSTHASHGEPLSDADEQNVALHELGHGLGILCTNNTDEIMTPEYTLRSSAKLISTLDVYGVARVFDWPSNSSNFYPVNNWLPSQPVILPSNITYQFLPVSPQNAVPQTLANNPIVETLVETFEILIHPDILPFVILSVIILIVIAFIPKIKKTFIPRIKKKQAPKAIG